MADAETWRPIPPLERRVLGVLVEKQKTSKTADAYPMTLNSIALGCNQKSNRDPVLELDDDEVEEVLDALQTKGVVGKMTGSRVDRWRHLLYELWRVSKVEMAVMAELLLRGPQSAGDLKPRASRMDPIGSADELRALLDALAARNLVVWLAPPDRRGALVTHGFHTDDELAEAKAGAGVPGDTAARPAGDSRLTALEAEVAELRARVDKLERGS